MLYADGHLLCRVNSVSELTNETAKVVELEKNYFQVGERKKRYFDMEDVDKFFCDFSVEKTYEYIMNRYRKPKFVTGLCGKEDISKKMHCSTR